MNTPDDQMATAWWDSLDDAERARWLDTAGSVGRDRTPLAAYTLRSDIERGASTLCISLTHAGTYSGKVVSDGRVVYGIGGCATEAEVREIARLQGFGGIPVLRIKYLADVPGFGIE